MKINFLTIQEIKLIQMDQINRYGGLHGLRDENLLNSAVNHPQSTFAGEYLHSDIYQMASSYMYDIIKNHPFLDGNKRTGLVTAILFLAYNDISLDVTEDELFELTLALTQSKITEAHVASFFKQKAASH